MLPSKFIPFLGRVGQELRCSFKLLFAYKFLHEVLLKSKNAKVACLKLDPSACPRTCETKSRQWVIDSVLTGPSDERFWLGFLVSTIRVSSLYQQEDTDGVYLSANSFRCQKREKKIL